jgi:hypothetical protein
VKYGTVKPHRSRSTFQNAYYLHYQRDYISALMMEAVRTSKTFSVSARLHGVISKKAAIFKFSAVNSHSVVSHGTQIMSVSASNPDRFQSKSYRRTVQLNGMQPIRVYEIYRG